MPPTADLAILLRKLAAAAAALPALTGGRYHYVHTKGWYLRSSQVLVGEELRHGESRMEEADREIWLASDGSGHIEEVVDGHRSEFCGGYGRGDLGVADEPVVNDGRLGPSARRRTRSLLRVLPDLWAGRAVQPAQQARLLEALAQESLTATSMPVIDRLGRAGVAIAETETALGSPSQLVVVLSDATGRLLATEEIALETAEWLPSDSPCTTSYTAFVRCGMVDEFLARPSASW